MPDPSKPYYANIFIDIKKWKGEKKIFFKI